ncbi:ABC transporter substrate-binding protein [uncultured Nocardioides sp.]|uniref:heme/hemin ABC transporter substrate-binding protein n=1 Tax=uncultured Nocardioides sp. TaxID=198441 RepID=UPI002605F3CE|nr:ABC transporter substrate-binding protein [uncultured Nocardioides sp.]
MTRTRRTARVAAVVLAAVVLHTGCAPLGSGPASGSEDGGERTSAVPAIGDTTPLDDPRSWEGPVDVTLPEESVGTTTAPRQQLPATVTDVQGTEVTVTDTSRILALDLSGTLARTVFELGLGDSVVGRDTSSGFPEIADRPLMTQDGHELNAEAILGLDPTVLITDTSLGPWDVVLQVRDAGVPVVVVDNERSLDNLASLTQQVGDALGVGPAAERLGSRIEADATEAADAVDAAAPEAATDRLRTVFLYLRGRSGVYYMFGEGSGADSLIRAAGGYDVADEIGWSGMKPLNDEGLVAAQPDVVITMTKGLESVDGVEGLLEQFPALARTPAGQQRRVVTMSDTQVLGFGPRTADVVNALGVALYSPDAL